MVDTYTISCLVLWSAVLPGETVYLDLSQCKSMGSDFLHLFFPN